MTKDLNYIMVEYNWKRIHYLRSYKGRYLRDCKDLQRKKSESVL